MAKVEVEKTTEQIAQERYALRCEIESQKAELLKIKAEFEDVPKLKAEIDDLKAEKKKADEDVKGSRKLLKEVLGEFEEARSIRLSELDSLEVSSANLRNAKSTIEGEIDKLTLDIYKLKSQKKELSLQIEQAMGGLVAARNNLSDLVDFLTKS